MSSRKIRDDWEDRNFFHLPGFDTRLLGSDSSHCSDRAIQVQCDYNHCVSLSKIVTSTTRISYVLYVEIGSFLRRDMREIFASICGVVRQHDVYKIKGGVWVEGAEEDILGQ
jgi:hypothetical protein